MYSQVLKKTLSFFNMEPHQSKLVDIRTLSQHLGVRIRTLRTWMAGRKIPYKKIGHRTILFNLQEVHEALDRFHVHAVGDNRTRSKGQGVRPEVEKSGTRSNGQRVRPEVEKSDET